jgi:hypothetical protein
MRVQDGPFPLNRVDKVTLTVERLPEGKMRVTRQNARHVKQLGRGKGARARSGARDSLGKRAPPHCEKRETPTNGTLQPRPMTLWARGRGAR